MCSTSTSPALVNGGRAPVKRKKTFSRLGKESHVTKVALTFVIRDSPISLNHSIIVVKRSTAAVRPAEGDRIVECFAVLAGPKG